MLEKEQLSFSMVEVGRVVIFAERFRLYLRLSRLCVNVAIPSLPFLNCCRSLKINKQETEAAAKDSLRFLFNLFKTISYLYIFI